MTRSSLEATAAFYSASRLTRVFRWTLGASQRLWPALGVRAATRLFATPLPSRWLTRQRALPSHWQMESWPFEGASLTVHDAGDADGTRPLVLLVHGWGGHAGQMLPLAEACRAAGLQALLLEMPAHGRSRGSRSNLPQFARALDYAAARLQQQGRAVQAVVAHSLAANAAAYAASRGLPARRLVLLAPPASPTEYTRLFARVFGLSERTRAAMQRGIESREAVLMPLFEPWAVGPRISQPTLVVHDRHDSINRFADGEAFHAAIAGAQMLATSELGHRHILKDAQVLRAVADFLTQPPRR